MNKRTKKIKSVWLYMKLWLFCKYISDLQFYNNRCKPWYVTLKCGSVNNPSTLNEKVFCLNDQIHIFQSRFKEISYFTLCCTTYSQQHPQHDVRRGGGGCKTLHLVVWKHLSTVNKHKNWSSPSELDIGSWCKPPF